MAVGGGSQRFSVQLNLNWFVFNTGDFSLSFKEVAGTLRRDGESLLRNSSYIQFFFGFAPVWSARESQRKISTLATDAKRQIEVNWRE